VTDELRRLILDLRPSILDNIGFIPAIRWLLDSVILDNQIDARLVIIGEDVKYLISRCYPFPYIQEALNNIRIHSRATNVLIHIQFIHSTVRIKISDNGKGFIVPKRIIP
jgi:signal transduction histidine kinase